MKPTSTATVEPRDLSYSAPAVGCAILMVAMPLSPSAALDSTLVVTGPGRCKWPRNKLGQAVGPGEPSTWICNHVLQDIGP